MEAGATDELYMSDSQQIPHLFKIFSRKDAKTQRRKALPRFSRLFLRLCAFALERFPQSSRS